MSKIRVALELREPLFREVLGYLLASAGMEVVGHAADPSALLCSMPDLRPDVVFLSTSGLSSEPGICSQLLRQYPHLKIVVLSPDQYAISDIGVRTRRFSELSMESIRASLERSFTDDEW